MKGINADYCNVAISAVLGANQNLKTTSVKEALGPTPYGKRDTIGLDAIPEITIQEEIRRHDPDTVLITEEIGHNVELKEKMRGRDPESQPIIFFCDPTDRSAFFKKFLQHFEKDSGSEEVGNVLRSQEARALWESGAGAPISITGATSAITCVRNGKIPFAVILNYLTQELFVACSAGSYRFSLYNTDGKEVNSVSIETVIARGDPIEFPEIRGQEDQWSNWKAFVTFMGSPTKTGYADNFKDSMIFIDEGGRSPHHREPGGPSRILYLSTLQSQGNKPIGFILANGEKIGEWLHWLPFVRFSHTRGSRSLSIYEICHERPWTKEGVLMSTTPAYSLFQGNPGHDGGVIIDVRQLARFTNPSLFRSTLLVTTTGNQWALRTMVAHRYREIVLPPTMLI